MQGSYARLVNRPALQGAIFAALKWAAIVFFVVTSFYGLLAFLPYTYQAFIKAPPYEWMVGFTRHYVVLYWIVAFAIALAFLPGHRSSVVLCLIALLFGGGIFVSCGPSISDIQNGWGAYAVALAALFPAGAIAGLDLWRRWPGREQEPEISGSLACSTATYFAVIAALLHAAGTRMRGLEQTHHSSAVRDLALLLWSVISHVVLAILIISLLNLIRIFAAKASRPWTTTVLLSFGVLWMVFWALTVRFFANALSFQGWPAQLYAASFALSVVVFLALILLRVLGNGRPLRTSSSGVKTKSFLYAAVAAFALAALLVPLMQREMDWNSVLQRSAVLTVWFGLSLALYRCRPKPAHYSGPAIVATLLLSIVGYKALQISQIFWSRPLGTTDDEISRQLERYSNFDVSFRLAHYSLGNGRTERCGELCGILRQHTNIREPGAIAELKLVEHLAPRAGEKPHIFILVVDSLRQDYVGAYNRHVDFTPNLDALSRDGVVFRNAYTQYAGTTLAEPSIWLGAMPLHTHKMEVFRDANSLARLLRTEGYEMFVSVDTVLKELLPPLPDLIPLDTDKQIWNRFEACSTLDQLKAQLDSRRDKMKPIFFYAQPMNVHQFAINDLPRFKNGGWNRHGLSKRLAFRLQQVDTCVGQFLTYLKEQKLYDNSIIIVTADHGDATGELGRQSHSHYIFPEVMRVPLIVHLPKKMRGRYSYNEHRLTSLIDITPSLYYLLGHRPVLRHPILGRPLFMSTKKELESYIRDHLLFASDVRAVYGILAEDGRFLFVTYDVPAENFLFDLAADPKGERNIVNDNVRKKYQRQIVEDLQMIADFYGYKPGVWLLRSNHVVMY
jgi:arylsulfatase A-like enzyme